MANNGSGGLSWSATSSLGIALADTTGTLGATRGGTGLSSFSTGDLLYASGSNTLANRTIGTTGDVLSVVGGIPTWVATSSLGFSGGGGGSGTVSSGLAGQVAFYGADGTAISGTSTLFFANGNIGIIQ